MMAARAARGWQMVFLSADLAAITEAEAVGFAPHRRLAFAPDAEGTVAMWLTVARRTSDYRAGRRGDMTFDDRDRQRQRREQQRRTRPAPRRQGGL